MRRHDPTKLLPASPVRERDAFEQNYSRNSLNVFWAYYTDKIADHHTFEILSYCMTAPAEGFIYLLNSPSE